MDTCLKHHFLLAMPALTTDYFGNSITYICEHNDDGAMGLIINRPMELSIADVLEQVGITVSGDLDTPVLEGGPVQTDRGFILHTDEASADVSLALGNGLMLSTAPQTLEAIGCGEGPRRFLFALGYAGWDSGQLESELAANAWLTCPASEDILFDVPFEKRIDQAAASLGINFHLMSPQPGHA